MRSGFIFIKSKNKAAILTWCRCFGDTGSLWLTVRRSKRGPRSKRRCRCWTWRRCTRSPRHTSRCPRWSPLTGRSFSMAQPPQQRDRCLLLLPRGRKLKIESKLSFWHLYRHFKGINGAWRSSQTCFFFLIWANPGLFFVYFRPFYITNQLQIEKA